MSTGSSPEEVLARYDPAVRAKLIALRDTILETARETDGVGALEETLKWGQVSYLTSASRSGTTIRIDAAPDGGVAFFVSCHSSLVATYRQLYPRAFGYEGDREVRLPARELDRDALKHCLALAMTYHQRKTKPA